MSKKKNFFITFEGIEGSGKSYQSKILYKNLINRNIKTILTREPGGTPGAELIRNVILDDYFHRNLKDQFDKNTDTLLYLAARNEHVKNKIKPALKKGLNVICDRFIDSTTAYQVLGKGVDNKLINFIHKFILNGAKPDLTFVLTANISKAMNRIKMRRKKNRYDKFNKNFYEKVQNSFKKIAKSNKGRYYIIDNSSDSNLVEKSILNVVLKKLSKC